MDTGNDGTGPLGWGCKLCFLAWGLDWIVMVSGCNRWCSDKSSDSCFVCFSFSVGVSGLEKVGLRLRAK